MIARLILAVILVSCTPFVGARAWIAQAPAAAGGGSWALIAHQKCGSASTGCTTAAINNTGADLILLFVGCFTSTGSTFCNVGQVSDSSGNLYTEVGAVGAWSSGSFAGHIFYKQAPTVTGSQTFTVACSAGACFPSMEVMTFSGSIATPLDQQNFGNILSGTTIATGSITPLHNQELIASVLVSDSSSSTVAIDASLSITDQQANSGGNFLQGAGAWFNQITAGAISPTWSNLTGVGTAVAGIASFRSQ